MQGPTFLQVKYTIPIRNLFLILYKSFAQALMVILIELNIDYQGIDLDGLVKLAK